MRTIATVVALAVFAACTSKAAPKASADPSKAPLGLEPLQLVAAADNPYSAAKYELGKQLFFEPRLSGTGKTACVSCHLPEHAFTDQRATSPKDDGKLNTRNSPTMANVGYLDRLYWDGRAKSLEGNVLAAWKAQIGGKPEEVAKKLAEVPDYAKAFQAAFGAAPSETNTVQALATFLRHLRSGNSAFDKFTAGDKKALSEQAQAGMGLFMGKAGCVVCHTPPLFTDKLFHNVGIGMAAENPDVGAAAKNAFDDANRTGQFKTPTLRDAAVTGPYFHDGGTKTLREAVALMAKGGLDNKNKDPLLMDRGLTDAEIDQLTAFVESLTGTIEFVAPTLPK
ncbi:MAG: c-type cytochrome [Planctomycetes bacterium]|nr:c-type cytochrome [Planctomycetota bacterium]